jgi:3-oxoadipate enol-lactonase
MKVVVNGIQLGYEIVGENGPPLLLLHGFGMNRTIWMDMVNQNLADQLTILPDLRGHGESDVPEGVYTMSLMADDISRLLDYLGFDQIIICGHSMGGYVALAFAEKYPEKILGLGLITTRSIADSEETKANRYALAAKVEKQGTIIMAKSLAPKLTSDPRIIEQTYQILMGTAPLGVIGASLGMAERPNRTGVLDQLLQPALVVAGEQDQIIPVEEAQEMVKHLKHGDFLSIPGTGHLPMIETPEMLSKGLFDLLQSVKDHQL